jgi:hypothetical protein
VIISGQIRFRGVFDGKHREVFGGKRRGRIYHGRRGLQEYLDEVQRQLDEYLAAE